MRSRGGEEADGDNGRFERFWAGAGLDMASLMCVVVKVGVNDKMYQLNRWSIA